MKMNDIHFQCLEKTNEVVHTSAQLLFSHCLIAIYKMHLSGIVRKNRAFKSFGNVSLIAVEFVFTGNPPWVFSVFYCEELSGNIYVMHVSDLIHEF